MNRIKNFRYWFIAVICVMIFIPSMAYQQFRAADKYKHHRERYCSANFASTTEKESCIEERTNADEYLNWGYGLFSFPIAITAWAVIATCFFIAWQALLTRDAIVATDKQAQHMIASERAWVVISSINKESPGAIPVYWWRITNVGKTPAKIVDTRAVCITDMVHGIFPAEPKYPPYSVQLNGRLLAPGEFMNFHTFWSNTEGTLSQERMSDNQSTMQTTEHLVVFGYVTYLTILDREIHESRFCDDCVYCVGSLTPRDAARYSFTPHLNCPESYSKST